MKALLVILAVLASGSALATGKPPSAPESPVQTTSVDQAQGQGQEQQQAQGQSQEASQANSQALTVRQVRQAPTVLADATNTTSECAQAVGGSLSLAGFGIGAHRALADKDCRLAIAAEREDSRGNALAAVRLRCRISYYVEALGDDCFALLEQKPVYVPSRTREEVRQFIQQHTTK